MSSYESIIPKLRDNHIYPIVIHRVIGEDYIGEISGLEVACNSFTMDSKKEHIEKVLGSGWVITWMGANHNYLLVTKK